MAQIIFAENEIYHIFNRGLDRRPVFLTRWDFLRARKTLDFYRFKNSSLSLGKALVLKKQEREAFFLDLEKEENKQEEEKKDDKE